MFSPLPARVSRAWTALSASMVSSGSPAMRSSPSRLDLKSKVDPYLRPLYDALFDMLGAETYQKYLERGNIEVAPLACYCSSRHKP